MGMKYTYDDYRHLHEPISDKDWELMKMYWSALDKEGRKRFLSEQKHYEKRGGMNQLVYWRKAKNEPTDDHAPS